MKIITKKTYFSIVCYAFTVMCLIIIFAEMIINKGMNPTQFNVFCCFLLSALGVLILSQHYRLNHLPMILVIFIQYGVGVVVILFTMKFFSSIGFYVHPNGYRDMLVSFTIPYLCGSAIYYIKLKNEVKRQNIMIRKLQEER